MTKQEQFLWIVQTAVLANCGNLASQPSQIDQYRHEISATGVLGTAGDAIYASECIPEEMSAIDAACDFVGFMLSNLRDGAEEAEGRKRNCPAWFRR